MLHAHHADRIENWDLHLHCTCRITPPFHGPLTRYVKLRVAHAPGMPGTFSLSPGSKETASSQSRHAPRHVRHALAVMHVGIANPRWRGKHFRHSRRRCNGQFYVSGKRPMQQGSLCMWNPLSCMYKTWTNWQITCPMAYNNASLRKVTLPFTAEKYQWRGALMFSVICAWTNGWANNRDAGVLKGHRSHYNVTLMAM